MFVDEVTPLPDDCATVNVCGTIVADFPLPIAFDFVTVDDQVVLLPVFPEVLEPAGVEEAAVELSVQLNNAVVTAKGETTLRYGVACGGSARSAGEAVSLVAVVKVIVLEP